MKKRFFITGTDTEIGKTYISIGLIKAFQNNGFNSIGIKPIGSGGQLIDGKIYNDDGLKFYNLINGKINYDLINPISLLSPVSPHIADKNLNLNYVIDKIQASLDLNYEILIIEGAGGITTPLNLKENISDLIEFYDFDIIMVVGMKLGCINHATLTYEFIKRKNLKLVGWIANCIDQNMLELEDNIETIQNLINAPCLGIINFNENPVNNLNINYLLNVTSP